MENKVDPSFENSVKQAAQFDNDVIDGVSAYKLDEKVALRQPRDPKIYMVSGSDAKDYLSRGYRSVTGEELKAYDDAEKMGTLGQIGIGLFDAADAIFLTVPKRIYNHVADPQNVRVMNELENQGYGGDIGSVIGTVLTMGEGLAAKPANAAINIGDSLLAKMSRKAIPEAEQIAKKAAQGSPSIAESIFKKVGGGIKEGTVKGLVHGAALTAPAASVEFTFGNTDEAAEMMLMGAGLGAGFEGIVGGVLGGVKSIGDISEGIKNSTNKLIKKVYGVNKDSAELIKSGKLDEFTQKINDEADAISKKDLQRRIDTLNAIGVDPMTLPSEAVFTDPKNLAKSREVEKIDLPFEGLKYQNERQNVISRIEGATRAELEGKTSSISGQPDEILAGVVTDGIKNKILTEAKPIQDQYRALEEIVRDVKMFGPTYEENLLFPVQEHYSYFQTKKNVIKKFLDSKNNTETTGTTALRESIAKRMDNAQNGEDWISLMHDLRTERNEVFNLGYSSVSKKSKGDIFSKAISEMEEGNILFGSRLAEATIPNIYPNLNLKYKEFKEKYGKVLEDLTGRELSNIQDIQDILSDRLFSEKVLDNFIKDEKTYRNIKLHALFPEQFKIATSVKIRDLIISSTKNGRLSTRTLLSKISHLDETTQSLMFGEIKKKLLNDLNHLFGGINNLSEAATKSITGDIIDAATGAGALVGGVFGGVGGSAVAVGAIKTGKAIGNLFEIMKLNTEKDAIIKAAMSTEQELVTKNIARAMTRGNEAHKTIAAWVDKIFDGKKFRLSKIDIPSLVIEEKRKSEGIEETYEKNLELVKNATAHADYIKQQISEKANSFSKVPSVHLNYLNKSSNAIEVLRELSKGQLPIKSKSFFKLPKVKPSNNQMLQFNNQMKAFKSPFKIVEDLSNGIISPDSIKIAETVYPQVVARIRKTISDKLMNVENVEMNYQDRLKLGLFLGTDLDGSMQHIAIYNQQAQNTHNQELNQQTKQLKLSGNVRSPAQSIGEA